jgi:glucosyl-dolichyl phosphate glucuronosyltransferase
VTPGPGIDPRDCPARDITVILCTYNRCRDLETALESLAASEVPSSVTWEVLVVDNNSTDETREVVEAFCHRHSGRFRYLFEPKVGKSCALNAGIANACGSVLAFVDDDVTVGPTWLHNLTATLYDGDWAGTGGRILPAETFTLPAWLQGDLFDWAGMLWGSFDLGSNACELRRAPHGANMAFRKSALERYGGFRVDLGPQGNSRMLNEDTELGRRLLAAGERLRYEPSAVVYHPVRKERLAREYFFSWWFDFGRATIREIGVWPDVYGIPRDYLRVVRCAMVMAGWTPRWILGVNPQKRFWAKCRVWHGAGMMAELYRRSIDPKSEKVVGVHVAPLPRPGKSV